MTDTPKTDSIEQVLLITQSDTKAEQEATYQEYIRKTIPIMGKYGGKVIAVGGGIAIDSATHQYQNNAVLSFPSADVLQQFLSDPQYREIHQLQITSVENLHTAYFRSRAANANPEAVARQAFAAFEDGLASGEWEPFLAMLIEDFTFHFPRGEWAGEHQGKDSAREFFAYVSRAYPEGLFITDVTNVGVAGSSVLFEFQDEGKLFGKPYSGRVVVVFDVTDDKISGYREYFG